MNCRDFENKIDLLAREDDSPPRDADSQTRGDNSSSRGADDGARAEMLAHEASCADCAARLADERALTSALRALASSMEAAEAPARVEAALLSSLRAHAAHAAVAVDESKAVAEVEGKAARASNVLPMPERANFKAWSWAKSLAVASLAAAAAVALFVLAPQFFSPKKTSDVARTQTETGSQKTGSPDNSKQSGNSTSGDNANANALSGSTPDNPQLAVSHDDDGPRQQPTIQEEDPTPRLSPTLTAPRRPTSPMRASDVSMRTNGGSNAVQPVSETVGDADAAEIATDFIPLVQGGQFGQAEGGHLVRVELPRSAMASFGLPVNYERADGRVKADVLLGDDGIARAIRFVR
jgi:hypothetical protein